MFQFEPGRHRVMAVDYGRTAERSAPPPTLDEFRATLARIAGRDWSPREPRWLSR